MHLECLWMLSLEQNSSYLGKWLYILSKKKSAWKLQYRYWKFLSINSLRKFKNIYFGNLKWGYLKTILVTVKLLQPCRWNLLYMWSIFQCLIRRIDILCVIFFYVTGTLHSYTFVSNIHGNGVRNFFCYSLIYRVCNLSLLGTG